MQVKARKNTLIAKYHEKVPVAVADGCVGNSPPHQAVRLKSKNTEGGKERRNERGTEIK